MILTVTPNTGLDRVLFLDRLERNERNQADDVALSMGGKGCDVSLVLRELGEESVATGLAAGENGRRMESLLRAAGVTPDFVWTEGETRLNTVLIERASGDHTTITAEGLAPDPAALSALKAWVVRWAASASAVVLAGSLPVCWPPAVYTELIQCAASDGRAVVVDATGECLRQAVAEGVAGVKPNLRELESLYGPLPSRSEVIRAATDFQSSGPARVLVTLGAEGALLVSEAGVWSSEGLQVAAINPAGAGDGATACLALGASRGWDEETTLREAVAVSAAIVTTRGTAELRLDDVKALRSRVRVRRVA